MSVTVRIPSPLRPLTGGAVVVLDATDPVIVGGGPIGADGTCRPLMRGRSAPGLPAGSYRLGVTGPVSADLDDPSPPLPFDPATCTALRRSGRPWASRYATMWSMSQRFASAARPVRS